MKRRWSRVELVLVWALLFSAGVTLIAFATISAYKGSLEAILLTNAGVVVILLMILHRLLGSISLSKPTCSAKSEKTKA